MAVMPVSVAVAMVAMAPFFAAHLFTSHFLVAPVVAAVVLAIPAVAGRRRWRVVTGGLHVLTLRILPLPVRTLHGWALRPVVRLALCNAFANGGTRCAADPCTQYRAIAASGGLADRRTGCTADSAADDGTFAARAVGADCCTGGAANGTAYDSTLASTHLLAQNGPRCRTNTTAQNGFQSIGMCWCAQGTQHQGAGSDQCGNDLAGCELPGRQRGRRQHISGVGRKALTARCDGLPSTNGSPGTGDDPVNKVLQFAHGHYIAKPWQCSAV